MLKQGICCMLAVVAIAGTWKAASGQTPCMGVGGPDVIVGVITGPSNYSSVSGWEALSLGTTSCNMGTAPLHWDACPANTHPVIGGTLFKYSVVNGAGRFEQVGQSWLKHGFTALANSDCCPCQNPGTGTLLGVGCSDPYTSGRNGTQTNMGPKYLVNAHTGAYPSYTTTCGLPRPSGGNTGRLEVQISDLVATAGGPTATTRYFGQAQYVTPDDATSNNQDNNCSYIEVTVSGSGTAWTFGFLGSTVQQFPAISKWREIDPSVIQTDLAVTEADGRKSRIVLSSKATSLGAGRYHYEYACFNMNSDLCVRSFSIPVSPYANITNIGFRDVDYRGGDGVSASGTGGVNYDGTDWPATVANGTITWSTQTYATNQGANAIRWGTQYNFRFDADVAPAPANGNATMVPFKPGGAPFTGAAAVPGAVACNKGDVNGDGVVDGDDIGMFANILMGGTATATQRCAADVNSPPDGVVDTTDVAPFTSCMLAGGSCL